MRRACTPAKPAAQVWRRRLALFGLLGLLALAPALSPPGADGRPHRGKTAQKLNIAISLRGQHQLRLLRVKVRLRCRDGGLLYDDLSDFEPTRLRPGGRFADLQVGPTDRVSWRGRLRGGRIVGRIRVTDRLRNGVPCDSGAVSFTARPRAGRQPA